MKLKHLILFLTITILSFTIVACTEDNVSTTSSSQSAYNRNSNKKNSNSSNNSSNSNKNKNANKSDILKVHFIDVGQADAILVETNNKSMLIDAGNNGDGKTVVDYLSKHSIKKIDTVIGTHPHEDHIGGLDTAIDSFTVGKVILPNITTTTKTFESVLDSIAAKNLKITKPEVGKKYSLNDASYTILSPSKDYIKNYNNWSVGIKLTYKNTSFVMCGDAETTAEKDIIASGIDLSCNVLKLGHHGSDTSSSDEFLDATSPEYAIMEVGKDNKYGHPCKSTLDKLKKRKIKSYRTDKNGTIVAISDGKTIKFETEK